MMKIVNVNVNDLLEYDNNPRINDDAVDVVANSISEFGFKVPIIISSDYVIVAGHTRLKASKKLGLKEVPCIIADDLTDEQIKVQLSTPFCQFGRKRRSFYFKKVKSR